jgi:large subunit ribosomal protein L31
MAKKSIHPKYYPSAEVTCSCGNKFQVGATLENIEVEICSACHPFYTGDDKGKARGSQVEKFKERMSQKIK